MLWLGWWGVRGALAGVPVALPAGERASDWEPVLALGGLEWSPAGGTVAVSADGGAWTVRIRGAGGVRETSVPAPVTGEDREDLVWLVVSLLTPVVSPEPPPVVEADPPPPPAPRPRPRPLPPHPPAAVPDGPVFAVPVSAVAVEPEFGPEEEPPEEMLAIPNRVPDPGPERPIEVRAPGERQGSIRARGPALPTAPAPDRMVRPWGIVSGALGLRIGLEPAAGVGLASGLAWGQLGIGAGVVLASPTPLPLAGPGRSMAATPVFGEAWVAPRPARLGLRLGGEIRRFREGGERVYSGVMPFARLGAAVGAYLGRRVWLEPGLGYRLDLGTTEVRVDGVFVHELPSTTVEGTLSVGIR